MTQFQFFEDLLGIHIYLDDGWAMDWTKQQFDALFITISRQSPALRRMFLSGSRAKCYLLVLCLLEQKWPELQGLTFSDISMGDPDNRFCVNTAQGPFIKFLALHPKLEELRLQTLESDRIQPFSFSDLTCQDLPVLRSFQGE
jgi:hypothetical protein